MSWKSPRNVADQLTNGAHLQREGDFEGAVACYQRALSLDPKSSAAYNNLANVFASLGDRGTALTFYKAALMINPESAVLHSNIANLYLEQEEVASAILCYSRAITLQPKVAAFHSNLGNALRLNEQFAEAEREFNAAIHVNGPSAGAHVNLGTLFWEQERFADAEASFRSAIQLDPQHALAHTNLSYMLLLRGELAEGWQEHEWRWRCSNFSSPKRSFAVPQWAGQELREETLFVHAEQGFGDTLQFLRYIPLLAAKSIRVVLEVHPELKRLAETLHGVSRLIVRGDPLPPFDWHCPLMSLPFIFETRLENIPANTPYLSTDSSPAAGSIPAIKDALRVGIVWRSSLSTTTSKKRTMPTRAFQALAGLEHVCFFCLQLCPTKEELRNCPLHFVEFLDKRSDFAATAEKVATLDLVITVDTSTAHLAGALGKPVWVLLPKVADWRWLTERNDSPWYPHTHLYRQSDSGDWLSVVKMVADDLTQLAKAHVTRK